MAGKGYSVCTNLWFQVHPDTVPIIMGPGPLGLLRLKFTIFYGNIVTVFISCLYTLSLAYPWSPVSQVLLFKVAQSELQLL